MDRVIAPHLLTFNLVTQLLKLSYKITELFK